MVTITLDTWIKAPTDVVFDLSRSIDLHIYSVTETKEEAIDGVQNGLIGLGQMVTWRAKHFGKYRTLQVQITKMERPRHFTDVMVAGDFKSMQHKHLFQAHDGGTLMRDIFRFEVPYGVIGRLLEILVMKRYLRYFLKKRNRILKQVAESGQTAQFLSH